MAASTERNSTPAARAARDKWRKRNPEAHRSHSKKAALKYSTGWTYEARDAALLAQGGACAICSREMEPPCCDHCHTRKVPRALLCQACNVSLGWYERWQRPAGLRLDGYETYLAAHSG